MENILAQIAHCVEFGKINLASPYPPDMKGMEGADELTRKALESGVHPKEILTGGLVEGMAKVGVKFRENKVFVPQVLMSAKAMSTAMMHLKPYFASGAVQRKGTFIIGTVAGDLHDIGKNLVAMMCEGAGFEVIDIGFNVEPEKFVEGIKQHQPQVVGMSAMLTTTMRNMGHTIKAIEEAGLRDRVKIMVGGAPVDADFSKRIGADGYGSNAPAGADLAKQFVGVA